MKSIVFLICFLLIFFTINSKAFSLTYSLNECIEIALKKNPEILASKQQLNKSFFKIAEAQSGYFPEISISLGYQKIYNETQISKEQSNYSGHITLSHTIFDFGKTATKVEIQRQLYKAAESQDRETTLETIYNVKSNYFNLLKAKKQRETAEEVLKQAQRHLELAKGFYEVGLKPKIELTKAEVELSNAKLNLISSEKSLKQALLNLKIAMGAVLMQDFDIKEEDYTVKKFDESESINIAFERNPQLQAIRFNKQASVYSEDLIKREYLPTLTGMGKFGYSGEEFPLDRGWSLGVQINLPIFSGWSTTYKLKQTKAETIYYQYKEEALIQQIVSHIKNLFVKLKEAYQRIDTLKTALRQAKENLDLAMGRYEVGVGSSIEVVDAIVLYEQTNTQYWQAVFDYNVTYAEIEKTIGMGE